MTRNRSSEKDSKSAGFSGLGLGELFEGISRLVEAAGKLKESGGGCPGVGSQGSEGSEGSEGGGVSRTGEFTIPGLGDKGKGIFGFTIRTLGEGAAGRAGGVRIQPFGNVRKGRDGLSVEEAREPVVDVFEEAECIRVIAELPGVSADAIQHEVRGDILTLRTTGERRYTAEVLLPAAVKKESAVSSYNNGIFELRLSKA